jgi:hypothetical protein
VQAQDLRTLDDGPVVDVTLPAQLDAEYGSFNVTATRGGSRPFDYAARVIQDGYHLHDLACPYAGYRTPNIRVHVTQAIPSIRVLANQRRGGGGILIRLSDGRVLCAYEVNRGIDHIDTDLPVGVHEVYLGALTGEVHPMTVGFTLNTTTEYLPEDP